MTPDRGKVACMAAGARRPKSSLSGVLDLFNRLEIVYYWKDGRSVQRLAEASVLETYPAIKADLERSVCAAFPLEIAYKAAQENEPSEAAVSRRSSAGWLPWRSGRATAGRTRRGRRFG
ncbi:MAG: DNA repair protein RecO [Candidatus Hydrogenedentales bacterium]